VISNNGEIIRRSNLKIEECYPEMAMSLMQENYSYIHEVDVSKILYWSDGLKVVGYIVKPKGNGKYPCIIFNRGGNRDFSAIDGNVIVNLLGRIASWGYVVVASQYRGHGENEGHDEFGGRDIDDVMNLFPILEEEECADSTRIGMYGGSRGGMMTYLALTRTDRIRAAVVRCGVSDLTQWREDRDDMEEVFSELIPGFDSTKDDLLQARSAVYWADRLCKTTPILLMQGTADWRVSPLSALRFAERLLAVKHPFRLVMLEGSDHALTEHKAERDRMTREWFDRYVRDETSLPQLEPHGA